MKTLLSAGFTFIFKLVWFILLGVVVNTILTFVHFDHIAKLFVGEDLVMGVVTLVTLILFTLVWILMAKKEALFTALFKVVDKSMDELVAFIIDKFVRDDNRDKLGDYTAVLERQPKTVQILLGFFFEKIDFFGEVSKLLKEKNYTNEELKVKMVETTREKELFEEWKPTLWTPFLLLVVNVATIPLVEYLYGLFVK